MLECRARSSVRAGLADDGSMAVAARLGVNRGMVTRWQARFLARRLDALDDEPCQGVLRTITNTQEEKVVVRTLEEASRAPRTGPSGSWPAGTSVHRIWRSFGLRSWRTEELKMSPDPLLIERSAT